MHVDHYRRRRSSSDYQLPRLPFCWLFGSHHKHHNIKNDGHNHQHGRTSSSNGCLVTIFILCQLLSFTCSQQTDDGSYLDQSFGDELDFDIFDKTYPNKPQNVSLRATGTNSISIHWLPPYEPVQGYKIKFRIKGTKKQETITINSSYHYYELKNLEKATGYQIKMAAIFANDTGPYTDWFNVETLQRDLDETQVPDMPSSLRAKPEGSSIYVTWTPPKNRNIVVRGYIIGWGEGFPDRYTQVIQGDQRFFTIDNISATSEYVISLRATNLKGEGQPIYETVKITLDSNKDQSLMLPPIGLKATVVSSTAIALDWTDTNRDPSNPDNRWYLVRHTSSIHSSSPRYRYLNTTKLSCLVEDLKPNTQYEFSVKVIKNKRNSTWSMSVLNTTYEAVPSTAPRDLTVVSANDDDPSVINLHWQPPKQPNGQITGYVIFYTMDNTQQDRDWSIKVITGDKLNAVLDGLQSSSVYYFKIQARNNKGYGPFSTEVSFRTLPAVMKTQQQTSANNESSVSMYTFILIITTVAIIVFIFFSIILKVFFKSEKNSKNRKGYSAASTSPDGKNTNSRLNNTRELKPPDLWIHHNEQVEMKLMDKNSGDNDSPGANVRNNVDNSFAKIKKTNSTYGVNSALYDDINKSPSSPVDNMGMATMRRSTSIRPKTSSCMDHSILNGMINMEPSTGLSRPLYPKAQFNLPHMDTVDSSNMAFNGPNTLHLYDPVSGSGAHIALTNHLHENNVTNIHPGMNSLNNSYMSSGNSSSPHSVISNNTVLTNSSTGTNITNSSTSPPNTSIYLSNNRPKPGHSALKSFGVPTPPPALPSLATLGGLQNNSHNSIYNSAISSMASPSKKFLLTTTNNLNNSTICGSNSTLASNSKSATNFSDDNSISASFNPDDLHQEMANLDNLMKDLNAMKPNHGMESC